MKDENFVLGLQLILKSKPKSSGDYNLRAEHDLFIVGELSWKISKEDKYTLGKLGWEYNKDVDGWSTDI